MGIRHIAHALYETPGLEPTAKLVLICLADRMNDDHAGYCWPSLERIAETVGINHRNTRHHVQNLEAAGLIEVVRTPGRPSKYRLSTTQVAGDRGVAHDRGTQVARDLTPRSPTTPEPLRTRRDNQNQPWSRSADGLPASRPVADVLADQDNYQ